MKTKSIDIKDVPVRNKLTSDPIISLRNIKYKQSWLKPNGFWYGLRHYWLDFYTNGWARKEASKFKYKGFIYEIKISKDLFTTIDAPDKNKILLIKSIKDLKTLEQIYDNKIMINKKENKEISELEKLIGKPTLFVNWTQVAKDFGGIEIKHNPWSNGQTIVNDNYHNYLPFWFSAWDVPSGCIWSYDLLKQIKYILR